MNFYSPIERWEIPSSIWATSQEEMAVYGNHGLEGIALWLGTRHDGTSRISHVVLLRGSAIRRKRYLIEIQPSIVSELTDIACERNVVLVGQIHSHAPECRTDLSEADRRYGFSVPYFLSIVAPDFAVRPEVTVQDCGVHVFEPQRGYRRFSSREVMERILMTTDDDVDRIVLGGVI